MSETTTATVAAPKTERAARLIKAAAKVAKHTNGAVAKDSKRLRLFKLLAKKPNGLNNVQIREALKTDAIAVMCRDEVAHGRLKHATPPEGARGAYFTLSAKGKQALEKGKVDSDKAPSAK